ncbi:MAG TPA: D-alanyl-D-alanine carboxypeptidase/D-alanyl-D-alanine-endopeptidase [Candidatus Acidoferrales bacterium]|nr:D-alanyl-D-alanine carboxypeptidase/D-alanyl-D-alanine-endopeptidase [Candidatus Acidoferrales bacterium]
MATALILAPPARAQSSSRAKEAFSKARPDAVRFGARVKAVLEEAHAARTYWGILVADRDTGRTLYELNADHFFAPASNAKIFVTALALATLGSDYRFHTTLESKGALGSEGRLNGDLILVGRGDPDLSNRKFPYAGRFERDGPVEKALAELADEAVANGLREVDGDVAADDSYFPYDPYPAGWSTGDLFFTFGAPVSAIALNENTFSIEVQPGGHAGEPATVQTAPEAALGTFTQEITTGPAESKPDFAVVRQPGLNFLLLRGVIPAGHSPIRLDLAMSAPAQTAALALKQVLEARGVRVTGEIRVQHAPPPETTAAGEPIVPRVSPPPAQNPLVLAEHVSPPLLESIRVTNKISQNLHAELFLRMLGREKMGLGSTAAGLKVERESLQAAGIASGDVVLSDGSGLARDDVVTPRAVVTLLRYASSQPWGRDFLSTLPVAGADGTLEDRMKNTAASGLIEAKTGTTERVRALSGYATTLRGESLVFSIFANNDPERVPDATAAVDAIATAMVETLGATPRPHPRK